MKTQLLTNATQSYPNHDWHRVTKEISTLFNADELATATVTQLYGGYSPDEMFFLNVAGLEYVLRMFGPSRSKDYCHNFIVISNWASKTDFGPHIHYVDSMHEFFIMEKLPGRHLSLNDFASDAMIVKLGTTQAEIHALAAPENLTGDSLYMQGQKWFHETGIHLQTLPSKMKIAYEKWLQLHEDLDTDGTKAVMQHGDYAQKNMFLCDGKIKLVDWEFASIDDPRRELARTCNWFDLNGKRKDLFLKAYYGREASAKEKKDIETFIAMIHLELSWRILSVLDATQFDQQQWDALYQTTDSYTLHDFVLAHSDEDIKEVTIDALNSAVVGHIKFFLQQTI